MSPALLALIQALAVVEVADYMTSQAAAGNDPGDDRSERPASDIDRKAA